MTEEKHGMSRIYRKSWCHDNLFGSLRHDLDAAQRGIWNDLLDLAKLSRVRPGLIAPNDKQAYSQEWLAAFLNVPLDLFNEACRLLVATERITMNGTGIEIVNWKKYQTEYDRQKPYRKEKKTREERIKERDYTGGEHGHLVKH
jgi:hypothetical protein